MMRILLLIIALVLAWGPMLPGAASAAVVGRLTQVDGRVDLLKGGKLPATPVKVGDRVDAGDVLRSKSLSKAQITFIDSSVINLSPESRLAIEDYRFEPDQGKRWAVLQLFQGLAHVVVNKIYKVEEPDFIVKTHTAVTGVRGTDFGIRLHPNASTILNFEGVTRVGNIFPEVHTWERRVAKIAYQPPPGGGSFFAPGGFVDLFVDQGTTVQSGLLPTLPFNITPEDRQLFMNQMSSGLLGRQGSGSGGPGGTGGGADFGPRGTGGGASGFALASDTGPGSSSLGLTTGTGDTAVTLLNTVTVPPMVTPTSGGGSTPTPSPTPTPTPSTFSFTQQYYGGGAWMTLSDAPYNQSTLLAYSWGQRTGVYEGYFYSIAEGTRTSPGGGTDFYPSLMTGTNTATASGTVTGFLGQALTGTMDATLNTPSGSTIIRTGTVTILPTGQLTYNWTDTVTGPGGVAQGTGTGATTQTPGTYFSQTVSGHEATTANLAGNQATATNYGDLTGTRAINGMSSEIIKAGYSATATALNADTFSSNEPRDVTITSEGVLGAPDANGVRVGVMTSTATTATDTTKSGGPVRDVPASGASPAATFATGIADPPAGTSAPTLGISAQTTNLSAVIITSTYEGSGAIASSPPYTTGTFSSPGWGKASASMGGSSETAPYTGSMTATVTQTGSGTFKPGPEVLQYTGAAVVLPDPSYTYFQGPAQGIGISAPHTVISITGTGAGDLSTGVGATSFNGTWVSPDSKGTLTNGTLTVTPGEYFKQTTNAGTGQVTLSTPTTTAPYTQTGTLSATMTRTDVAPGTQVLTLPPSNVITSTTNVPNALPLAGTVPATINIQGVVAPGGTVQSGNMTMTTHPAPGGPVSTYMGPVTINTTTNALNATVVGKNPANPGVNRAHATQTGAVGSAPSP